MELIFLCCSFCDLSNFPSEKLENDIYASDYKKIKRHLSLIQQAMSIGTDVSR